MTSRLGTGKWKTFFYSVLNKISNIFSLLNRYVLVYYIMPAGESFQISFLLFTCTQARIIFFRFMNLDQWPVAPDFWETMQFCEF